jgi:hypothetical protein
MMVNLDDAATTTWQIIPQSNSEALVNTRFEFTASGGLRTLVSDGAGGGFYQDITATVPSGYFELRIDVERATSVFTVYFNGSEIFTGQGFAGNIEQVVVLSPMESAGPVFDVDDLAIIDGSPKSPFLTYYPKSGSVPPGGSIDLVVAFDASDLEEGIYKKVISIASNDPVTPVVEIPAVLNAMDNDAPVLGAVSDTTVVETETLKLTFTATDEDDASVKVALLSPPSFVSLVSTGNGTTTYAIKPQFGDAGDYYLTVIAQDPRGARDSATFKLTVLPYGIANFSLINSRTGQVVRDFDGSITLDVADPLFRKYIIRANTYPGKVGSVLFKMDGKKTNIENRAPYILEPTVILQLLDKGAHKLLAEAYTKADAKGKKTKSATAIITITNSQTITGFEVVNKWGDKIMDIGNGGKINIRQSEFKHFTIIAKTSGQGIGSVRFDLNGRHYHSENLSPYSMTGNLFGFFPDWDPKAGRYTLKATPYSDGLGCGIAGESLTITFEVVTKGASVPSSKGSNSVARDSAPLEVEAETVADKFSVVLHPVPVRDDINLTTTGELQGDVTVIIHNAEGKLMYQGSIGEGKLDNHQISTSKLGMNRGIYYLQVINKQGERYVKKFVKE